jgi:hypothetical protein
MTTTTTTPEQLLVPRTLADLAAVRRAAQLTVLTGCVPGAEPTRASSYADQLAGWLLGIGQGESVSSRSSGTVSRYRRILANIADRAGHYALEQLPVEQALERPLLELEGLAQELLERLAQLEREQHQLAQLEREAQHQLGGA